MIVTVLDLKIIKLSLSLLEVDYIGRKSDEQCVSLGAGIVI